MYKKINRFLIILILFIGINDVSATDIGGSGNAGNYGSGGGTGGSCSDKKQGNYNGTSGLRVTLVKSNGTKLYSKDFYSKNNEYGNKPSSSIGNNCSKFEYIKGTCASRKNLVVAWDIYNFMSGKDTKQNITKVFQYLEGNSYSNLKKLIKETGYNCIDNAGNSECSISDMRDTYIVVEPMAMFGRKFATAYEMEKIGAECWLNNLWGKFASFMSDGKFNLTDKVGVSSKPKFYNAIKDKTSNNGIMIYSMSDIVILNQEGSLTITKKDKNTNATVSGIEFYLKENNNYRCITNWSGVCTISNIPYGNYTLIEDKTTANNKGYQTASNKSIIIDSDNKNIEIKNEKTCSLELNLIKNNALDNNKKLELIRLYETYKLNGLLNFNNPECKLVTCGNSITSCLSSNVDTDEFNSNNLSCYNDKLMYSNNNNQIKNAYCKTSFTLIPNYKINKENNLGRLFIESLNNDIAAKGTLTKTCYIYDGIKETDSEDKVSDYLQSAQLQSNSLTIQNLNSKLQFQITGNEEYTSITNTDFLFNPIYSIIGTGKTKDDVNKNYDENCNNCKLLGYGIATNLYYKNNPKKINLDFSYKFRSKTLTSTCSFDLPKEQLVENNKLNLEFRIVNISNPFSGIKGNERNPGTNWRFDTSKLNNITKQQLDDYIKNNTLYNQIYDLNTDGIVDYNDMEFLEYVSNKNGSNIMLLSDYTFETTNDSYNKNKTGYKYRIELDSKKIKAIRNYNKKTTYSNWDTIKYDKQNNTRALSCYLQTLENEYVLDIKVDNYDIWRNYKKIICK